MKGLGKKFGKLMLAGALSFGAVNADEVTNVQEDNATKVSTTLATPTPQPTSTPTPTPTPQPTSTPTPTPTLTPTPTPSCDENTKPQNISDFDVTDNPTKPKQEYVAGKGGSCTVECKEVPGEYETIHITNETKTAADDTCISIATNMTNPTDINGTKDTDSEYVPMFFSGITVMVPNPNYNENLNDVNTTGGDKGNTGEGGPKKKQL